MAHFLYIAIRQNAELNIILMKALTEEGKTKIHDLAIKYGISLDAVNNMLQAVSYGHGTQAQFNIAEFGGMGQWMKGGMTMVGDMFNHSLKNTVNNLCSELSHLIHTDDNFIEPSTEKAHEFFGTGTWWPSEFGSPSSNGSQNNMKYAYFGPPVSRLVIENDGKKSIYDTLKFIISGVSQSQVGSQNLSFSSQLGPVNLQSLILISEPGITGSDDGAIYSNAEGAITKDISDTVFPTPGKDDIFVSIEKLGVLLQKDLINREEFESKKAELLKKL